MEAGTTVDPNVAVNTAGGGMTMQQLSHLLRLAYHTTPFGDPHPAPFNYTGPTAAFAEAQCSFCPAQTCCVIWSRFGACGKRLVPNMPAAYNSRNILRNFDFFSQRVVPLGVLTVIVI